MHIANYADNRTTYIYGENMEFLIKSLEQTANLLFNWSKNNQMKVNEGKCPLCLSTDETVHVNLGTTRIKSSKCEKLLGIKTGSKPCFDDHIRHICKKTYAKLKALAIVAHYMNTEKKRLIRRLAISFPFRKLHIFIRRRNNFE